MNILIADKFSEYWKNELEKKGHNISYDPSLTENTLKDAIKNNVILIVRSTKVNSATIDAGADLKLIIRAGAGYNTIDTAYAKTKDIAVCNCPGTNSLAVAELAMGLMLSLDRRIYHNVKDLKDKKWNKKEYSTKAKGLFGRTLGIIGLGAIGREIAKRAAAFGMELIGYDPYLKDEDFKKLNVTKHDDIYSLAEKADIITIHIPETPETKGIFNDKFFSKMKENSYFINTSRGGTVDQKALIKAAKEKSIRVGLDVYSDEPDANAKKFDSEITQVEHVYGTHHIGASTAQAQDAVAQVTVNIINEFEKSGQFLNRVN